LTISHSKNIFKCTLLWFFALFILGGCNSIDVESPYLAARPYQHFAAKADAWLIEAQQASGLLPYYFRPSTATADPKTYRLGQLIAAERIARLARDRSRAKAVSREQISGMATSWPELSGKNTELLRTQMNLGEHALWLRVLLLTPSSTKQRDQVKTQAESLISRYSAQRGFPEKQNQDTIYSRFMQRYFTGHAALALFEHSDATTNTESLKIAEASLNWLETNYPASDATNFHPTLVPWHALAIAAQYKLNGASPHIKTLYIMSDQLVDLQSDPEFPGRFFTETAPNFGRPNVVRDALSTITLMTSLNIAIDLGDRKRQKKYRKAIWLALDNLRSLQYDHGVVTNFEQPMKAVGALRFRHNDERIRLDGVVFSAEVFERAAIMIQNGRL
jgi:hypothetical protein